MRAGVARTYRRRLGVPSSPAEWLHAGPCFPGNVRLFVAPDGVIYPCQQTPMGPAWRVGSVSDGVCPEAVADFLNAFYDITADLCPDCWAVRLCALCPAMVTTAEMCGDRSDTEGIRNRCERIRASIDHHLRLMCEILERNPRALDDPARSPG